jgi:hypothetical protein
LAGVTSAAPPYSDHLTEEERAWIAKDERLWEEAHRIAAAHPGMDVSGVYHVLRNLEKRPAVRLRAALQHGRHLRARTG